MLVALVVASVFHRLFSKSLAQPVLDVVEPVEAGLDLAPEIMLYVAAGLSYRSDQLSSFFLRNLPQRFILGNSSTGTISRRPFLTCIITNPSMSIPAFFRRVSSIVTRPPDK